MTVSTALDDVSGGNVELNYEDLVRNYVVSVAADNITAMSRLRSQIPGVPMGDTCYIYVVRPSLIN